jgi:alanine racemase
MRSRHVQIIVNLEQIRQAAERIRRMTGVRLIAVIKADAYGLGAVPVADALADIADEFAYFTLAEAREVGRPGLVLGPPEGEPAEYLELNLRPTISCLEDAERFAGLPVAIKVDTGLQRFGCRPEQLCELLGRCRAVDIYTHATSVEAVEFFDQLTRGRPQWRHAACTFLLGHRQAWLEGVRPGLALYQGAMRVSTRLWQVRRTRGPAGYGGFDYPYVGVILAGYCHNLRPAPVLINGRRQRVLEVGMNCSFVSVDPEDRAGDEVVLLGDGLSETELAACLDCRPHEILCRYGSMGQRSYIPSTRRAGGIVRPRAIRL